VLVSLPPSTSGRHARLTVNQENERDRVSSCKYDGMDELRELAVRTALFEHLDDSLLASDDDTLGWNQTESFKFNGEVFSIRQAFGRASVNLRNSMAHCRSRQRSHHLESNPF